MNEQVMIYEVKISASSDAAKLFSDDDKYFYWNATKFKHLHIGDYIFVVSRINRWMLFAQLDKTNIAATFPGETTHFHDLKKEFAVSGRWNKFIRLKIIQQLAIPDNWQWQTLGSSETTYLNGSRISLANAGNRIRNIQQLKELTDDTEIKRLLDNCINNFVNTAGPTTPSVWFVTQGEKFKEGHGMNFLWAPQKGKDGRSRFYWDNVLKVKKGDFVFNYSSGALKGISLATSDGYEAPNHDINSSAEPQTGYGVDITPTLLTPPLKGSLLAQHIQSFAHHLHSIAHKPFNLNGAINQGYLYEFTKEAGRYIRNLYGQPFGNREIDTFFDQVQLQSAVQPDNDYSIEYPHILTAIKTKPFILLAGISGTGKSRLARALAYKTCHKAALQMNISKPGNFELIPVRPNWHDSSELMGYVSRINGEKYITTTFLQFIAKAWQHTDVPFFLCMDEMNLAPVEQYFAEYLSVLETRQVQDNQIVSDYLISKAGFENPELYEQLLCDIGLAENPRFAQGISIPQNLIVIGTVNMDETTHSFSRKVLDRAMTFEMNQIDLAAGLANAQDDWIYPAAFIPSEAIIGSYTSGAAVISAFTDYEKVITVLQNINDALEGTPFKVAYRVRDEFLIYCYYASRNSTTPDWLRLAMDQMIAMKILYRIEGDESRTGAAIDRLLQLLHTDNYPQSYQKLLEMKNKLLFGYTSPWS